MHLGGRGLTGLLGGPPPPPVFRRYSCFVLWRCFFDDDDDEASLQARGGHVVSDTPTAIAGRERCQKKPSHTRRSWRTIRTSPSYALGPSGGESLSNRVARTPSHSLGSPGEATERRSYTWKQNTIAKKPTNRKETTHQGHEFRNRRIIMAFSALFELPASLCHLPTPCGRWARSIYRFPEGS